MTYVLAGTTAPIEYKRREVPSDPDEARALLEQLVPGKPTSWYEDQDDAQVAERVAESRVPEEVPTTNGQSIFEMSFPDDWSVKQCADRFATAWKQSSTENPSWIESDNKALATVLIANYTEGKVEPKTRMPSDWMVDSEGNPPTPVWSGISALMTLALFAALFLATRFQLRTNAGRDFQSRVMGDGTEGNAGTGNMRPADYLALTENAAAPALSDTTLAGELAAGGLARAQAAYAHVAASTTYTLVYEWTSSDGSARTINKMAVFNASTGGTMVFESLVPSPPTLVAGDRLEITSTVDIS